MVVKVDGTYLLGRETALVDKEPDNVPSRDFLFSPGGDVEGGYGRSGDAAVGVVAELAGIVELDVFLDVLVGTDEHESVAGGIDTGSAAVAMGVALGS